MGAAALFRPAMGSAQTASPVFTRRIPSSGEELPAVGLGSWITFNVGEDVAARDECAVGRPWTQAELFGIMPDPTAVATLGLLAAAPRAGWILWVVPLGWITFSGATQWTMHSPDWRVVPGLALCSAALAVKSRLRPAST